MTSVASGFYNIRTRSEPHHWLYAKFEETGGQQKFVTDYGYGHLTIAENDGDMNAIELVLVPSRYMFMFSNICSN